MADILIKNLGLPSENEQVNITILPDGSVIEHFRNESGKWSSYRSGGVKAVALPPHGELCDKDKLKEEAGGTYQWRQVIEAIKNAPVVLEESK